MKKVLALILFSACAMFAQKPAHYEAEILKNPNRGGKDTRQVNAVLEFHEDFLRVVSRRKNEVFKELKYADIKSVEHSFSKTPFVSDDSAANFWLLAAGISPIFYKKEKHWLTVVSDNDFFVLKIENDNYRLIKPEFAIRKIKIDNINEDRQ